MKKFLIIIGVLLVAFVGILISLPIIYKDEIKSAIDKELATSVDADVYFDADQFGLTLFNNFPNITATLGDFGIVGRKKFSGIPLLDVRSFEIELNTWSMIASEQSRINGIELIDPKIYVKILEDGTANYNIIVEDSTLNESEDEGALSAGLDHWQITNGNLIYDDASENIFTKLIGINHTGSGNISQNIFDLKSRTSVDTVSYIFEGIKYLGDKRVEMDMTLNMDFVTSKYTFKENTIRINQLPFGFEGYLVIDGDDYDMDINFSAKDTEFKSLLSLIPGVFTEGFEDIKSEGEIAFNGFARGIYNDSQMPAFKLNVAVKDAMFQYPNLPQTVSNINIDGVIDCKDGVLENTSINLMNFNLDLGDNPINGKVNIANLKNYPIVADISAKLKLEELSSILPIEGTQLKGLFDLNLIADGIYDSISGEMPKLNIKMLLKDGYIKSTDFPIPMEKIQMSASIVNKTGKMENTVIDVSKLHMLMDGEEIQGALLLTNLKNYTWDLALKGTLDLDKITHIYPLEKTQLLGKLIVDVQTSGNMKDLDAEKYDRLPTKGSINITNLMYKSEDLPQGLTISKASTTLDPKKIIINNYVGTFGKSDVNINGSLTNYMAYILHDKEVLNGRMNMNSNNFDANEWMESEEVAVGSDEVPYEIVQLPENIDFTINSKIQTLTYDNLTLKNVDGQLVVKNGIMNMNDLKFNTLDGNFIVNGSYNPRDKQHPKYDMTLDIQNISLSQSYEAFNVVQKLAPIAKVLRGNFSTDLKMSGELNQDMMPNLKTVSAAGLVKIAQATLGDSKLLSGLNSFTQLKGTDQQTTLKDIAMNMKIENGQLGVKPFGLKLAGYDAIVSGGSSLNGDIKYALKLDIPSSDLGSNLSAKLGRLTGPDKNSMISLPLQITGTMTNPKFSLATGDVLKSTTATAKAAVVNKAKSEIDSAKSEAGKVVKEGLKNVLLGNAGDSTKTDPKEASKELEKKAKDRLKKLFK